VVSEVSALIPHPTPYQQAMARALDTHARVSPDIPAVKSIGIESFPADWLPWLVIHYGLESIAAYVGDLHSTLLEGRRWQRVRGTPAATESYVLDWLGIDGLAVPDASGGAGAIEENRSDNVKWWGYQIALTAAIPLDQVRALIGADALSKNAGTRLVRIYGGHDTRTMRWSQSRWSRSRWSDWSGTRVDGIAPKLSFRRMHRSQVAFETAATAGASTDRAGIGRFRRGFVWGRSRWDGDRFNPVRLGISSVLVSLRGAVATFSGAPWPSGPWPGTPWAEIGGEVYGGLDA
jgi:hypothetical protein